MFSGGRRPFFRDAGTFSHGSESFRPRNPQYDVAYGRLLGIEGTPVTPPSPSIVPTPTLALVTAGHPENYEVGEPLPAAGTAGIWSFVVQYVYQNAPFGQMSGPVTTIVRG